MASAKSSVQLDLTGEKVRRALLLTSTLKPSGSVYKLKRSQIDVRRADYLNSVRLWSQGNLDAWDCAFLVDNSPDMSPSLWAAFENEVSNCSRGRIIALHLDVEPEPATAIVQKGCGEAKLIDSAVHTLKERGVTYFAKVTGRLFVSNANRVIPKEYHSGITAALSNRLNISDSRFFSMPVAEWSRHFQKMSADINEPQGVYFEHTFARRTMRALSEGGSFVSMRQLPKYVGTSGSMDVNYGSYATRARESLKDILRMPYQKFNVTL